MKYLFFLISITCALLSCKEKKMFREIDPEQSGIHFSNEIIDNDSLNVLDVENIYNGAGIGIGDFNGDGLQDVFFASNVKPTKLYLNKGKFRFEDVTEISGVSGERKWCRGVSVVDINNDGKPDIYINATLNEDSSKRRNILYINKGNNANGVPIFENLAANYGLDDQAHGTMAVFFDYDRDGDLDMYLLVNEILKKQYPNTFRLPVNDGTHPGTDKLFRNDWSDSLGHPYFHDVSKQAGITFEGYGHGVNITDINMDGWPDIFVNNDFLSNNLLYINQRDGSFKNEITSYLKHTAENSMGLDIIDINNDALDDIIELDMNPEDNFRKKMMLNPINYSRYLNNEEYGYQFQYVRNTLHLNQGPTIMNDGSAGPPAFSDIGYLSGIAETDWSWAPVVADFDLDGYRDLIVTNGFPKDVTDHDFIAYRAKTSMRASKAELIEQMPIVKISNYAFRNNGDLTFKNETGNWGLDKPSFSNGAAYADFDNDGDLDLVISNINDKVLLYQNCVREFDSAPTQFLNIVLAGDSANINAIGSRVTIYYKDSKQAYEYSPYRGYLSTYQLMAHFGLGQTTVVDSVIVRWPDGTSQKQTNIKSNQNYVIRKSSASQPLPSITTPDPNSRLFQDVTLSAGLAYLHKERDFVDFNIQRLLPHKLSEYGPAIASGDLNGDGRTDLVVGGARTYIAQVFLQEVNGQFIRQNLYGQTDSTVEKLSEDMGLLLFDADNDNDLDLYIASGGYESKSLSSVYQDQLYINDGKGTFTVHPTALPKSLISKSCVRSADYDKDGDMDLFIGGRVEPGQYPNLVNSHVFRNDTKAGNVLFTDVTSEIAGSLINIGMITDAVFTDFNNDSWPDLVLAGEWSSLIFLQNNKGKFEDITTLSGIDQQKGWWNSLASGDFDNDGDIDYIAGNLGRNSYYRASDAEPVYITAKDFDGNGKYDAVPSLFLPTSAEDRTRKEFPAHLRDDIVEGMPGTRKKFLSYRSFAMAPFSEFIPEDLRKGAIRLSANHLSSSYIRNDGNGKFSIQDLPVQAQFSPINGMAVEDFNGDGNLDLVINGNEYGSEIQVGRYDAMNGLVLTGNGEGKFSPLSINESGIFIPDNGKSLAMLQGRDGSLMIAATQNRGPIKLYRGTRANKTIALQNDDVSAIIYYKNGRKQKREYYSGNSFLSQSSKFLVVTDQMTSVDVYKNSGEKRQIKF